MTIDMLSVGIIAVGILLSIATIINAIISHFRWKEATKEIAQMRKTLDNGLVLKMVEQGNRLTHLESVERLGYGVRAADEHITNILNAEQKTEKGATDG